MDLNSEASPPRNRRPHHKSPHISTIANQEISELIGYSGLILTVLLCIVFIVRHYVLQEFIFKRCYGKIWTEMSGHNRRSFMNHHIGGGIKLLTLFIGAYPWVNVVFGNSNFTDSLHKGSKATMGDLLIVLTQLFTCMYIFELLYREKLSPIAVAHHIGAIVIGQSAVVLSLDLNHQRDATIEFVMVLVWGAFDCLAEFWPNLAMIFYRTHHKNHYFLSQVFFYTSIIAVSGTLAETIMITVLLAQSWSRWEISFKIATPILHIIFTMAQLWGSWNLWSLYRVQRRKLEGSLGDPELAVQPKEQEGAKADDSDNSKTVRVAEITL